MMIKGRKSAMLLAAVVTVMAAWAGPRDPLQMRRAAVRVLTSNGMLEVAAANDIRLMEERPGLSVLGNDSAFAIISADDICPEVLAYSSTSYQTAVSNPHFNWWIRMTEQALAHVAPTTSHITVRKSRKRASEVAPLLKTSWGQRYPFNMYCPKLFPVGCVATATSQLLKYNEWPRKGQGTVFTYVPFGDLEGTRYEAELEEYEYSYESMADDYGNIASRSAGTEVATLMYHVGLAVKSNYAQRGTGTYNELLSHGLRNHLGYPYAVTINREFYTSEEWMDMVLASIDEGKPIIYGGSDEDYSGHEFVLDGYDEDGKVHINWGWDGDANGYFDLWPLFVYYYDFSNFQDMVVRCTTDCLSADTLVVDMSKAGTLRDMPGVNESVVCLKVRGPINGTDLKTLRTLAGVDGDGHGTHGQLSVLDLSEASIVAGGEPYLTDDGVELTTIDGVMPYKAFSQCFMLIDVRLPENLKSYGGAVFANCNNLDRVVIHPGQGSDFVVSAGMVLSADRRQLIECLPDGTASTIYVIPDGVREVCDYAFAGRFLYERLLIPESVERIGPFAFNRCFNLVRTYVFGDEPPFVDPTAVDTLDVSLRRLYVPVGCTSNYASAEGWGEYQGYIREFDKAADMLEEVRAGIIREAPRAVFDLQGRVVNSGDGRLRLSPGIYVSGRKKTVVR